MMPSIRSSSGICFKSLAFHRTIPGINCCLPQFSCTFKTPAKASPRNFIQRWPSNPGYILLPVLNAQCVTLFPKPGPTGLREHGSSIFPSKQKRPPIPFSSPPWRSIGCKEIPLRKEGDELSGGFIGLSLNNVLRHHCSQIKCRMCMQCTHQYQNHSLHGTSPWHGNNIHLPGKNRLFRHHRSFYHNHNNHNKLQPLSNLIYL